MEEDGLQKLRIKLPDLLISCSLLTPNEISGINSTNPPNAPRKPKPSSESNVPISASIPANTRETSIRNKIAPQYSARVDLPLKSKQRRKKSLMASGKLVILLCVITKAVPHELQNLLFSEFSVLHSLQKFAIFKSLKFIQIFVS